jgi:hypothetical protein
MRASRSLGPYWADLHNHNEIGFGKGSIERSYTIARGTHLDVYAFTVHGYWPDPPRNDPKLTEYHRRGFRELVQPAWSEVMAKADSENQDGEFVCFRGFEWHSSTWGDYHILLSDRSEPPLCIADDLSDLQSYARKNHALLIPHHCAYPLGWRGTNWSALDTGLSPVAEIHSEHGCGMEAVSPHPYLLHSMGGIDKSQTIQEQLKRGLRIGVTASTDNHFGHPASYGEGLTGIWSERLNRSSVLAALQARHTFAVTGDRISMEFYSNDGTMGDVVPARVPTNFRFSVKGWAPIESVRIIKNGDSAVAFCGDVNPVANRRDNESIVVRLEFGWDSMTSHDATDWRIRLFIDGGDFSDIQPGFSGGPGSHEMTNRILSFDARNIEVEAFTSRDNPRPTSEIAVRVNGRPESRIRCEFQAVKLGRKSEGEFSATLYQLRLEDRWETISDVFSDPKIRLGMYTEMTRCTYEGQWSDPNACSGDFYILRVLQTNGQMGWTSPIFVE